MLPNRFLTGAALINQPSGTAITYGHDPANRITGLNQGGVARAQSYDLTGILTLGRGVSGPKAQFMLAWGNALVVLHIF